MVTLVERLRRNFVAVVHVGSNPTRHPIQNKLGVCHDTIYRFKKKNRIIWSDSLVGQDTRFVILKPQFKSESDINKKI